MLFTHENYLEMIRQLSEHPEWQAELRQLILPEAEQGDVCTGAETADGQRRIESRLDRVEGALLELAEAQRRTEEQVHALAEAQNRTEKRLTQLEATVEKLAEAQRRTEEQVHALAEAQTRAEERLTRVEERLTGAEERLTRVEERLTGAEERLTRLEATVQKLVEAQMRAEERLTRLEATVQKLVEAQMRAEERLERLEATVQKLVEVTTRHTDQIAKLEGWQLEYQYTNKATAYFGNILRRVRVVHRENLADRLEDRMPRKDRADALLIDLVVSGKPEDRPDLGEMMIAVEISAVIDRGDVERARRRAALIEKVGIPVIPAVAGEGMTDGAKDEILKDPVLVLVNGHCEQWEQVLAKLHTKESNSET